ncbi:hypothetical protein Q9B79_09780 [Bacillus sp. MHSD_36]|uniref:hypothetical protein n=1 Tax=unclassified Bacillus (in: firmicutes) TaxID=185979 RepID=UPI002740FD91|nr:MULTISPECIES: hypothetical protein [unclassified Bacillus (in: firmicutes)]MDP7990070.1 hypothetical protein [Bacillus sp. MHSD_36]MDR4979156.1 hypothetical protein [Bacillus sp. MHSD_37]
MREQHENYNRKDITIVCIKSFSLFCFKASKSMKAMGVSLVYAILVRGYVLNFGLLPDFIVG